MASNEIENLKQLVRNWITAMLHVLETSDTETSANVVILLDSMAEADEAGRVLGRQILQILLPLQPTVLDSMAEADEAGRVLGRQILQILEENGMNTEAVVNAFNRARNQSFSLSDTEVQESVENLRQQIGEIPDNTRILELAQELQAYYERIINDGFLRGTFEEALQLVVEDSPSRHSNPWYMAEVKEKLREFLRKFLEVETALNDQHN